MSRNRFDEIVTHLHFNDNNEQKKQGEEGYNRCHKIQTLIEHFRSRFQEVTIPETKQSVDEQIIPTKARHGIKVYMKKKPVHWGYKLWVRAGVSGYVYDFEVYDCRAHGPPNGVNIPEAGFGESCCVVARLTHNLKEGHQVYFDNYFASPELLAYLLSRKIYASCTMQKNQTRECPLKCDKDLKKLGRGSYDYRTDGDEQFVICKWFDNKPVIVASNFDSFKSTEDCKRYDRMQKKYIQVPRPKLILTYNKLMGGVDKAGMLLALYRIVVKGRHWYLSIGLHFIDLAIINAWTLYRSTGGGRPLLDFRIDLARSLLLGATTNPHMVNDVADAGQPLKKRRRSNLHVDVALSTIPSHTYRNKQKIPSHNNAD